MLRRFVVTLIAAAGLLVGGLASAQSQIPDFQSGQVLRAMELNAIVRQLNANTQALNRGDGATHAVDCSSGTIGEVMPAAQPGDTITITGTCNETVVVNKDGITLDGGGTAIIDGGGADAPVIAVYGQQNVVIRGLTVQNGQQGVMADRGAAVWLEDVTAQNNGLGIFINGNSSATFAGTIRGNDNNALSGIEVRQSTLGADNLALVQANGNAQSGIVIHRGSQMLFFEEANSHIEVKNNTGIGLLCYLDCSVNIGSIGNPAVFEVTNNSGMGIWITTHAQLVLEGVAFTVSGNKGHGLGVSGFGTFETYGGYTYADITVPAGSAVISNNEGHGMSLRRISSAGIYSGGITISNNGRKGVSAWNGVDLDLYGATFTGNTEEDLDVSFGSRLGWGGNTTIGTVRCDDTVLTYNDAACP